MARIAAHLDGHGALSVQDVRMAAFDRPEPPSLGYDPDQVNEFLCRVADALPSRR